MNGPLPTKIAIGSASFGKKYGIFGKENGTSKDQVKKILAVAKKWKINAIDTAPAYGAAEEIIGEIGTSNLEITTKLNPLPENIKSEEVFGWICEQVDISLRKLNVNQVYGLLLHRPLDLLGMHKREIINAITHQKEKKAIKKFGFSIYSPSELEVFCPVLWPDIVQAPLNVFDRRILKSNWANKLTTHGSELHVRSVFLQGILLNPNKCLPEYFKPWARIFKKWRDSLNCRKITPLEYALAAVKNEETVSKIVVGVNSSQDLFDIIDAMNKQCFFQDNHLSCEDPNLIEPTKWKIS